MQVKSSYWETNHGNFKFLLMEALTKVTHDVAGARIIRQLLPLIIYTDYINRQFGTLSPGIFHRSRIKYGCARTTQNSSPTTPSCIININGLDLTWSKLVLLLAKPRGDYVQSVTSRGFSTRGNYKVSYKRLIFDLCLGRRSVKMSCFLFRGKFLFSS